MSSKFIKVLGYSLLIAGIALFLPYLLYLPLQDTFVNAEIPQLGLVLYCLSTGGAAFVAWGIIVIAASQSDRIDIRTVLKGTGIGSILLGVMRLGTFLFPHYPFHTMLVIPIVEAVTFIVLGIVLLRYNSQS